MNELEMYQETIQSLFEQRSKVTRMTQDKQIKHLPKLDTWIEEIKELIETEFRKTG